MSPRERMPVRGRVVGTLLSLPLLVGAGFVALVGLYGLAMRCDESCYPERGWAGDPDSWQWTAQGILALGVFSAAVALTGLLAAGRVRAAIWTGIAGVAALVAWSGVVFSSG